MSIPFAFFDTCSHLPDRNNSRFVMAANMRRVEPGVVEILAAAKRLGAPVLSTTCFGYQRGNPNMSAGATVRALTESAAPASSDLAFVGLEASADVVAKALGSRAIVIERLSCPTPDENVARRTFDVFSNPNTEPLVRALGERHWLLFGAGFEHCLLAVAEGLRARHQRVTVLEDGCIHGGRSTPASFRQVLERLDKVGAEWATLDTVLAAAVTR